jgi:hypothetical protein
MASSNTTPNTINSTSRSFAFGGGVVGLVTFLFVGLLPSIVYGGFAGVTMASSILGGPADGSLLGRGLVVFGMVVGLLGAGGVFIVIGAALGAGAYGLVRSASRSTTATPAESHLKA